MMMLDDVMLSVFMSDEGCFVPGLDRWLGCAGSQEWVACDQAACLSARRSKAPQRPPRALI